MSDIYVVSMQYQIDYIHTISSLIAPPYKDVFQELVLVQNGYLSRDIDY